MEEIKITKTIITHFYNEEYLLPWWLMHHTKIFDHGILINRGSTDRSAEICKLFAPHWEVRDSKFPEFDPAHTDIEVMEIERDVSGWKIVLNTTEFLCCNNAEEFFSSLHTLSENMYAIRMIVMVDKHDYPYSKLRYSIPLVQQRYHGVFPYNPKNGCAWRFIHNHLDGAYLPGRHYTLHKNIVYNYPSFIIKFYFSPWNEHTKARKLQITPTLSKASVQMGLQKHYGQSHEELETRFLEFSKHTQDLRNNPEYQQLFRKFNL
ncbi:glycosyltransferase family 2 protein [Bacillus luti]|uniref:glycosyltransferase family 2 protein n=1 Tax=Bacillus luti TaxID=2026191 RepID=UPI003CFF2A02